MTHGSLFSGIGGFDLAAAWAGWTNVFNCEIDPFCRRVLKYHFPESKYEELRLWQPCIEMEFGLYGYTENDGWEYIEPYYFVGDVVAVAQSYRDVCASGFEPNAAILRLFEDQRLASWSNKMFVKAELMPHQIRITGIKCERLYDISEA